MERVQVSEQFCAERLHSCVNTRKDCYVSGKCTSDALIQYMFGSVCYSNPSLVPPKRASIPNTEISYKRDHAKGNSNSETSGGLGFFVSLL